VKELPRIVHSILHRAQMGFPFSSRHLVGPSGS
jgi:hypothetical protein